MWSERTIQLIRAAVEEDLGTAGDITAALLDQPDGPATARVVPRSRGVICGLALAPTICAVFAERLERTVRFVASPAPELSAQPFWTDGMTTTPLDPVATITGPRGALLAVERTLLNFLARLSGVASLTREYVFAAESRHSACRILDTRKTLPGWRELDRYAVRMGGGHNHRAGLYDAILIKDNHLAGIPVDRLAATLTQWLGRWRSRPGSAAARFVEVEVDRLDQLHAVLTVEGIDVILLDNFSIDQVVLAVHHRDAAGLKGKVELEVSGGVTLPTVSHYAAAGVERIAVGALTHSAPQLDIGLDF